MKKILISRWMVLLTLVMLLVLRISDPFFVELIRLKSFDLIQYLTAEPKVSNNIVLLDIGERSLKEYGQWPWSRDKFSSLITKLRENGAKVIVFTVFFPEHDRLGNDPSFLKTLKNTSNILIAESATNDIINHIPNYDNFSIVGESPLPWLPSWQGPVKNIPSIENLTHTGMSVSYPDHDGNIRQIPLVIRIGNYVYSSLALEFIKMLSNNFHYEIKTDTNGIQSVRVIGFPIINTDKHGRVWIDFNNKFNRLEASDKDWSIVNNKNVFIGVTASGLASISHTASGQTYSHEIQASLAQTLLNGTMTNRSYNVDSIEIVVFMFFALIMIIVTPFIPAYYSIPIGGFYTLMTIVYGIIQWSNNILFDISYPVIAGTIIFAHLLLNNYMSEASLKKQITKQFGTYLAPALVTRLQDKPDFIELGGVVKEMTFLFTDIRGFTNTAEQYKDNPHGLVALLNRFLTPMTCIIINNFGIIDKYMGDNIMAFWNDPIDLPNQKELAVKSALEMQQTLKTLNIELEKEKILPLKIGIGINTGLCVVGNVGSKDKLNYSVIGDAVNLASRLESQSKEYGVDLIIGEDTVKDIEYKYFCIELDLITVKGKTEPTKIYTVLGSYEDYKNFIGAKFNHKLFLKYYREQRWELAQKVSLNLRKEFNGQLEDYYEVMSTRMLDLSKKYIENWDGIFIATDK